VTVSEAGGRSLKVRTRPGYVAASGSTE
jgi:hypothetical protein